MKSDLYKIIYRIAYFCVASSLVLLALIVFYSYRVFRFGLDNPSTMPMIIAIVVLGLLLLVASIVVAIYFKKCYNIAVEREALKVSEEDMVERFKEEMKASKESAFAEDEVE